jgi:hypothetical protein
LEADMNHIYEVTETGWHCVICKEEIKFEYAEISLPEGITKWDSIEKKTNYANSPPTIEYRTGDKFYFSLVKNFPMQTECKKAAAIDKLNYAMMRFLHDFAGTINSLETWQRAEEVIPEILRLAIEADKLLEHGLHSQVEYLTRIEKK